MAPPIHANQPEGQMPVSVTMGAIQSSRCCCSQCGSSPQADARGLGDPSDPVMSGSPRSTACSSLYPAVHTVTPPTHMRSSLCISECVKRGPAVGRAPGASHVWESKQARVFDGEEIRAGDTFYVAALRSPHCAPGCHVVLCS
ncbi:unnamed protein product [Pleuronectes platessa]|uniref:Uncharacterized protein n=1 Tax=Pleuronectes platessa TaxID=8262 RepID=A0A9N7VYS0_PLEPL|nr:unnamed protein product [Pleuronectes platessa]